MKLMSKVESLLFVSGDDGLTNKQLAFLTDTTEEEIDGILRKMIQTYKEREDRGLEIKQLAGTFQFVTKEENVLCIQKLVENPTTQSLSQASLRGISNYCV